MSESHFKICEIYCPEKESFEILKEYLKRFPVYIYGCIPKDDFDKSDISKQIVGWSYAKKLFPNHNILDKKIKENIYWCHSHEENKNDFYFQVENFVSESIKKWLPSNFVLYDPFINGDLKNFLSKEIKIEEYIYIYYNDGALYLRNGGNNFILNIKSIKISNKNYKKLLTNIFSEYKILPLSYQNLKKSFDIDSMDVKTIENIFWIKNGLELDPEKYFNIIPKVSYHKYVPFFLSIITDVELSDDEKVFLKRMQKRDKITAWISDQEVCFDSSFDLEDVDFLYKKGKKYIKFNYSDKRTLTGRLVVRDSFNIQNWNKDSLDRKKLISRFDDGRLLVCDYTSFETRISMHLTRDLNFIKRYNDKDIHYELAKEMFESDSVTSQQRDCAKVLSHTMLYGASRRLLIDKLSNQMSNPERGLYYAQKMLDPIIKLSNKTREEFNQRGFIKTYKGSIIVPNKEHAAFNNLVQATAAEILVDKLFEIRSLLKDKESKFLFQIHDSLVFDISPKEKVVIKNILETLSKFKKTSFALKYKIGKNYKDLGKEKFFIHSF